MIAPLPSANIIIARRKDERTIGVPDYLAILAIIFALLLLLPPEVPAVDFEYDLKTTGTSYVAVFPDVSNTSQDNVVSLVQIKPDLGIWVGSSWQAVIAPRFRLGISDPEYNFVSLDDVYGEYVGEQFEVRVGYQTHFWGAVESFNIVDILNQKDYTVDFLDPRTNKIGEPTIRLRAIFEENIIDFYYFPYFTPANLPDKVNPFNFFGGQLDISDDPIYTNPAERLRPQFALRVDRTIGSADVGVSYFNGYEKFPVSNSAPGFGEADTLYYEIQQVSGDIQMNFGSWLLKGEVLFQDTGPGGTFFANSVLGDGRIVRQNLVPNNLTALVGGFEYTFFRLLSESDLGVIIEYLYNSQQNVRAVGFRPFQNDVFTGIRWSRNNAGDGELLAGVIVDLPNQTQVWRVEYTERLFDRIKLFIVMENIHAAQGDSLEPLNSADRFALTLSYVQ